MSINYKESLSAMRVRRVGDDYILGKSELYESRGKSEATRYALGSMQQVDPEYTNTSIAEGERVSEHLGSSLSKNVSFRFQGSVPLNTHIRKASDIDLLVINETFFTYSTAGVRAKAGGYVGGYNNGLNDMIALRKECEESLQSHYYAAKVDTTGAKSIALSGGSFKRKVDVVPANWFDGVNYQLYGHDYLREIEVLDKNVPEGIVNSPFLFMHEVNIKDTRTQSGAKKAIRMLKNIKNDSSRRIDLSSYDITSLIWHMPNEKLNQPNYMELSILAHTQEYLDYLCRRPVFAKDLNTPDNSRKIIDSEDKFLSLTALSREVDALAAAVYKEILPVMPTLANSNQEPMYEDVRSKLFAEAIF